MAWPFLFEENFELGTKGRFNTEADTGSLLAFRHYSHLASYNATQIGAIAPWRGAYCMEIDLGDTNDHTLTEADIDIADTVTRYSRFYFFMGKDFTATADDTFNIYEVQSAGAAAEGAIGFRVTASTGLVEIGVGQLAPTVFAAQPFVKGRWACLELTSVIQTNGTGTQTLFLDGAQVATVTTLTNIAVSDGALGTQNTLSTTTGHLFFDAFVFDDTRIYPHTDRYPETIMLTQSAHVCLGQSELLNVTMIPGSETNNTLKIYDTDTANTNTEDNVTAYLVSLTALEPPIDLADVPNTVKRGAFVRIQTTTADDATGKMPRALIHVGHSQGYGSHGRIRQHGANRVGMGVITQ